MKYNRVDSRAVDMWSQGLYSLQMIGDAIGVSKQAIKKYLNKRGFKTDKGQAHLSVSCSDCGVKFNRVRCKVRATVRPYCSKACYYRAINNPTYVQSRTGTRHARAIISTVFLLEEKHIVHHKDSDQTNNSLDNLMVFRNSGDHTRWHRLGGAKSGVVPLL